jgi:hypothetical protein
MHNVKGLGFNVTPVALTGIAAALLDGGQTIHSKFRIPIYTDQNSSSNIEFQSEAAHSIRNTNIIIVDECSNISKFILECIDRLLRGLKKLPNIPFGGIPFLVAGDFRQTLPIADMETFETSINLCLKNSYLWKYFKKFKLVENVRANVEEIEFKDWQMKLGNGELPTIKDTSLVEIPERIICEDNLIDDIYGHDKLSIVELNKLNVSILTPINKDSLAINDLILDRLEGHYFSFIIIIQFIFNI